MRRRTEHSMKNLENYIKITGQKDILSHFAVKSVRGVNFWLQHGKFALKNITDFLTVLRQFILKGLIIISEGAEQHLLLMF